ncbi:MAG: hypothetical protein K9J37_06765 [Saprospiraceae bacterium]|nr:hypothetical protein [Saprospiraceae bacterium]MCF8249596.1 hypothetical protein [Saprospiraceae bacterium]MCF8280496.1 hypothetical protein [Bacteroidales bacterium]MCF8310428.1 hypothetical protein [Saprospiraceae bacterium]MCF8439806.1 hypothetical protein [Saprospiraceae bacterium]
MKREITSLLVIAALIFSGCFILGDDCDTFLPQKWHIGEIEAELITQKPILKVGDTFIFRFSLAKNLIDTANQEMNIDEGVQVFNKITTSSNLSDTTNNDFFAIDTTIFKVFDKYFDMMLIKGDTVNAYMHECELIGDYWEIETKYVAKKPGSYWARIEFWKIYTSDSNLGDGVCMEGDTETFGAKLIWKESEYNQIDLLFQDEKEKYPTYFGFIVEE